VPQLENNMLTLASYLRFREVALQGVARELHEKVVAGRSLRRRELLYGEDRWVQAFLKARLEVDQLIARAEQTLWTQVCGELSLPSMLTSLFKAGHYPVIHKHLRRLLLPPVLPSTPTASLEIYMQACARLVKDKTM
jgi:hypothetical protein